MSKKNIYLGRSGEELAVDFLRENGYRILARNYRSSLGEIDIIAREKETLCFIEVKARASTRFGLPQEAVSPAKQRQISRIALLFLKENNSLGKSARFDVVSVIYDAGAPRITLIRDAFEPQERYAV
ncbi:MAG: YraN family protein [Candidatus Omnitrophica bacterium]|nr:YraN family protein [Candidatus Omnitrophota bacterium]